MSTPRERANSSTFHRAWPAAILAVALLAGTLHAQTWTPSLSAERYKALTMFERAQYDKALNLFRGAEKQRQPKVFESAATEFNKYRVQFPDSPVVPHVLFMEAYSQHYAKNRHTAIKLYQEVLDYFAHDVPDAAPALYFMGQAHFDNGDTAKGLAVMKAMADHEEYRKHWLAAGAVRTLADHKWKTGEYDVAVHYWKQVVADFASANRDEARSAKDSVTAWYINQQNCSAMDEWLVNPDARDNAKHRKAVVEYALEVLSRIDRHPLKLGEIATPERRVEDRKAFFEYFKSRVEWYKQTDDLWTYHIHYWDLARGTGDKAGVQKAVDEIVKIVKAIAGDEARDAKWNWVVDRMVANREFELAQVVIGYMKNRVLAAWKVYELHARQEKWAECDKQLQGIEKMGDEAYASRALAARAHLYHHYMGRYEEAIKLYRTIGKPPGTLWAIQDCQYRMKKVDEAMRTLQEIETMFPPDASRAAWQQAWYMHQAGEDKTAVAMARRIMKVYPKSQESSRAHQLLEKYGVDTGLRETDEEF